MFLEVAVASPIFNTLTYKSNPDFPDSVYKPGLRLLVPLGPRLVTGYVLHCSNTLSEKSTYSIRNINDLLDTSPMFPESMVSFFKWLADYYHYPIGEVIKCALPGGLTPQSGREITLTDCGIQHFNSLAADKLPTQPWFHKLNTDKKLSVALARQLWRGKDRQLLKKWEKKAFITITQMVTNDSIKTKSEVCYSYVAPSSTNTPLTRPQSKTLSILKSLSNKNNHVWIARKEITRDYPGARKALIELETLGCVKMAQKTVYRNPFGERPPSYPIPETLTKEQSKALETIAASINSNQYAPFLIHGITGSGKTEVYLKAAEMALAKDKTVLVLVPEIALATQLEGNFLARFEDKVALLHSGLSTGERFDQWKRIIEKKATVVIGARSALFAPLDAIGLIIIDEEHDSAYKQEDTFRYQARDAAVLRASQNNATILLGSATPSIVSYQNAVSGKYTLINMSKRVLNKPLPEVEIIDLKSIPTTSGKPPMFSPQLIKAIKENHANGDQSIIFLNRRGYAQLLLCQACGKTLQCGHCNISLTLHHKKKALSCHYCGYSREASAECPHCKSHALITVGFGTERVEAELKKILPTATIARLDKDTTVQRKEFIKTLKQVHNKEIDILIGTQMIAKGHHFPGVTLVGVVWADASLGIPDYKSSERTFQVLTQVFGRAGRGEKPGKVVVQTHYPEHYCIITAQKHDYRTLFDHEITLRKSLSYPPFSRLLNVRFEGKNKKKVGECAQAIATFIRGHQYHSNMAILGPSPAPLSILRDQHRWQLLIKSSNLTVLNRISSSLLAQKARLAGMSSVKLTIDVDPESML